MSELHALLIGLDVYLDNWIEGVGRFPHLKGSVRDVTRVEEFLRCTLRVPPERIQKLTSTENGTNKPAEPQDRWPTYENMVAAFRQITAAASPGDQVYIHYSGHGARANTIFPKKKGKTGLDEALVPIDIGLTNARYLRDVELAALLKKMVTKGLLVTLVLDSCHAGSATRGSEEDHWEQIWVNGKCALSRGTRLVDETPRRTDSLVGSTEELLASWPDHPITTRDVEAVQGWLPQPTGYVLIAACTPEQAAYEFAFGKADEGNSGVLTHWLLDGLSQLQPGQTYQALYDRINAKVKSQFRQQTPVLAGEKSRIVFGADRPAQPSSVLVLSVEPAGRHVRLNTGQAQGVGLGARFALYRPEADLTREEERLGVVQVSQYSATECLADLLGDDPFRQGLGAGCCAVLIDGGPAQDQKSAIRFVYRSSLPASLEAQVFGPMAALLETRKDLFRVVSDDGPAHFLVALNEGHEIEIQDALGVPVPNLGSPLLAESPAAASAVVARLAHLARYRFVRNLSNADSKKPSIEVELLGIQDGYDKSKRPDPQPGTGGLNLEMAVGQWTFLRMVNRSPQILNVAVLDLQPDWGITQIFPGAKDENLRPLDPDEVFDLPLRGQLPLGITQGTDVLKVFATLGATDFRWLELPALFQEQAPTGAQRGMETEETVRAGDGDAFTPPSEEWTTAQVEVRIKRAPSSTGRVLRDGSPAGRF